MERSIEINLLPTSHRKGLARKKDRAEEPPSGGTGRNLGCGIETAIAMPIRAKLSYPAIAKDYGDGIPTSIWRMETGQYPLHND
ncbi:hypothetical protein NG791_03710 [Laspinema sp. D1]|uniref:hypothetical protein n=1 Tax=Laspinema palackyanum TaxID=3231601 RepID=UPI00348DCE18|nr:hypothetical protein [Laspinema sp. D2b]